MRLNAWLRSAAESAIGTARQARFQPDARRSLLGEEKQALRRHDCAPAMTLIDDINHSGPADDRAMDRNRPNYLEMLRGMQNLRSEERGVGQEWASTCRERGTP